MKHRSFTSCTWRGVGAHGAWRAAGVLALMGALAGLVGCDTSWSAGRASHPSWLAFNQNLIRSRLQEPSSAEFSRSFISQAGATSAICVCGEVDETAQAGTLGGHQRFISCGSAVQMLEAEVAPRTLSQTWAEICAAGEQRQQALFAHP